MPPRAALENVHNMVKIVHLFHDALMSLTYFISPLTYIQNETYEKAGIGEKLRKFNKVRSLSTKKGDIV